MLVEILALCTSLLLLYLCFKQNSWKNRPPGPFRFPIIGNIPQIATTGSKLPFVSFDILSKKHGPIMSLKIGMKEAIVVSSLEDMSELLNKDECQGRILDEFISDRSWGKQWGVIFSEGELWKTMRRYTIRNLRDFGFGKKNTLESVMGDEVTCFIEQIKLDAEKCNGKLKVYLFFNLSLLNVLWSMVAGKRFSYDDPRLNHLLGLVEEIFKAGNFGADIAIAFPFLRRFLESDKKFKSAFISLHKFFQDIIDDHRANGEYKHNPDSFVDVFLQKIDEAKKNPKQGEQDYYTDEQLSVILMDLFMTGSETLGGLLSYGLLFMTLNPEMQKKVQAEIDTVVGKEGEILFEHRNKMVYTQAVITETFRMGNIVPIIPPRKVLQDFEYKGYNFPKGMCVIPNLHSVYTSEKYFEDPEKFNPERFINPKTGELFNTEKVASSVFGFGKRFCMGETQATPATFLYFARLMQQFEFSTVPGEPKPTTEPLVAFTLTPQPFDVIVKSRY